MHCIIQQVSLITSKCEKCSIRKSVNISCDKRYMLFCTWFQAHKGYPEAMYRLGVFYYFGLRVSNTLAFYLAMASVMFAVVPSLPMPQEGVLEELGRARHIMSLSLFLLLTSIGCTLVSFAAASAVVVDGEHYYGASDLLLKPSIIGWFVCLIAMASFCIRVMRLVFYRNSVVRLIYKFNFGAFCEKIGSPSWTIIFCLTVLWWIAVVFFTILVFLPLAMCSRRAIRPRLETITECWPDEYKMIKARRTSNLFRMLTCREELDSD